MVNEQDEGDNKLQKPDVFHLWVKLKLPKEEQGTDINGDQKIGFRNYKDAITMNKHCNNTERVCHVCHKVFSSGKALGGHMRIHVIPRANIKNKLIKQEENPKSVKEKKITTTNMIDVEPKCTICGKDFPSMKALFGHMRSHPERDYRGIHPPRASIAKKNPSSSSFSSSLSEADQPVKKDETSAVDLTESLQGWAVTARRGRKAAATSPELSSSDEDQLRQAVTHLMMLSRGGGENKETANRFCKNKRKRKKVKLCDLGSAMKSGVDQLTSKTASWAEKYRCSCCERSFATHQALGGHMSSHNRSNNNVIREKNENIIVSDDYYPTKSQVEEEERNRRGGSMSSNMVLEFDLNEAPPTSDGEAGFDLSEFSTW